jgi:gamma-glutamylcyclotransferase (GGCT)/AIG2-like uncharacterized protein YtfP
MPDTTEPVFVYGTLRKGGSNHFRMDGADFHAAGTVRGRLYHIDWYPGLVLDPLAECVSGEVYQVPTSMFNALDQFEGDAYRRVQAEVSFQNPVLPPTRAWVWEWLGEVDESRRIAGGDWFAVA